MLPEEIYVETIYGKLSYLYGSDVAESVFSGNVDYVLSSRGRVREVYIGKTLLFTLRVSDGYLLPTLEGSKHIKNVVVVNDDAVPFVKSGKSVIAKSVVYISEDVFPGEEVAVYSRSGELLAVGRLLLSPYEIRSVERGIAVKVRHHKK